MTKTETVKLGAGAFALALAAATMSGCTASTDAASAPAAVVPGAAGEPYPGMPAIAPIGVSIGKYMDVPASAQGQAIASAKGYRLQDLGKGLYMVTDGVYQSMFLVYDSGVVVIDAPPSYAARIPQAIAEVSDKPITHVVYSHSHTDHIGGIKALGGHAVVIAHEETLRLLKRAADPNRPLPTVTFADQYTLRAGGQVLELSYHGNGHQPGNIFISAPAQRVLMVVDVVFPGWMPWRRFAVAQDVQGSFAQVEEIRKLDWDTLVGGHVARTGTHADVDVQAEFDADVRQAASKALATTTLGAGLNVLDQSNPWAVFDNYIDRVAAQCVERLTPKWASRLAAIDGLRLGPVLLDGAEPAYRIGPSFLERGELVRLHYDVIIIGGGPAGEHCAAVHAFMSMSNRARMRGAKNILTLKHAAEKAAPVLSVAAMMLYGSTALAQSATHTCRPGQVIPLTGMEPAAKLVIDAPLAGPLASRGVVVIPYCAENMRLAAVFGPGALAVSPRVGHIHVTVDDAPWHWADASGDPLILRGMPPGRHMVRIELVDANHQPIDQGTVTFDVPKKTAAGHRPLRE